MNDAGEAIALGLLGGMMFALAFLLALLFASHMGWF